VGGQQPIEDTVMMILGGQIANAELLQAMNEDPEFARMMEELRPGIRSQLVSRSSTISDRSPTGWTWHHSVEEGVMELVPRVQHSAAGLIQTLLHPGGAGGFSIWG
jgi:hypothetical protein